MPDPKSFAMRPSKDSDDRADETRCDERPEHADGQSEAEIVVDETLGAGAEPERPPTSAREFPEQGAGRSGTPTVALDTYGDEHEQRHPVTTKTLMLDQDDSVQPLDGADSEPPSRGKTLDLDEDRGHATPGRPGTPTVALENLDDGKEPHQQVTRTLIFDQDDSVQPSDRADSEPPSRGKTLDLDEDRGHATPGHSGAPTVAFENPDDGQEPHQQVTKTLIFDQDDSVQPPDHADSEPPGRGKTLDLDEDRGHPTPGRPGAPTVAFENSDASAKRDEADPATRTTMLNQSDTASRQPTGQQKTLSLDDERDRSGPNDRVTSPEPTVLDDTSPKRSPRDVSANVPSQNETLDLEDPRGSAPLDPVLPQLSPSKPIESDPDHGPNRAPKQGAAQLANASIPSRAVIGNVETTRSSHAINVTTTIKDRVRKTYEPEQLIRNTSRALALAMLAMLISVACSILTSEASTIIYACAVAALICGAFWCSRYYRLLRKLRRLQV
jgi:hypothetical protein